MKYFVKNKKPDRLSFIVSAYVYFYFMCELGKVEVAK